MATIRCSLHFTSDVIFTAYQLGWAKSTVGSVKLSVFAVFILKLIYLDQRDSASIADMSTIRCALYSRFAAKYSKHQPLFGISSLVPVKSSVIAVLQIFRLKYSNECISVFIAHMATIRCRLHFTSDVICTAHQLGWAMSTLVSVKPSCFAYSCLTIQITVSPFALQIYR